MRALLPEPLLDAADQQALEALALLLVRAAAELQLVFADSGKVDYSYVAAAAREALSEQGEPSDFALRAGAALRHILVDEFQDTSYEQFELLRALTAGWERGDGRTLFIVGDPMQSIYQFREAEVGLFLRARDCGVGERSASSRCSCGAIFAPARQLIDWVNAQFARLFPPDDDRATCGDALFLGSAGVRRARAAAPDSAVTLHRLHAGDRAGRGRARGRDRALRRGAARAAPQHRGAGGEP